MRIVTKAADDRGSDPPAGHHVGPHRRVPVSTGWPGSTSHDASATPAPRVAVPSTLNVSSLDLLHPGLVRLDRTTSSLAREQMDAYVAMGCRPTWTCAPYQLPDTPGVRRPDRVGRVERDRVRQLGAGRANRALQRLHRHLLRDHGARTRRRVCTWTSIVVPGVVFRVEGVPDRLLADPVAHAAIGLRDRARGGRLACRRSSAYRLPPPPRTT